jgi:predicted regulator of Ras-like GTPase activity (Roadblock/LC7/MglB family)
VIELPLNEILTSLPNDLAAQVLSPPGVMFSLSTGVAVEQLRTGAVRIPFSQLRQGSPPGTFTPSGTHDDSLIDLPLPLILAAIGPGGLARRPDQKRASVPDDVTGVFGAKHTQFSHTAEKTAAPAETLKNEPTLQTPRALVDQKNPRPNVAATIPAPVLPKPAAPAVPFPGAPKPTTSVTPAPVAPKTTAPTALPFAAPKKSSPLPFASARPVPPPPAAPAPPSGNVVVTVETVSAAWPEAVRSEILGSNLAIALISIPVHRLEPGMKTGRVVFTWAEVRGWLNNPAPSSAHDESQVELPLKVIAPLFLAKQRATTQRKVVNAGENLPDLFAGVVRPAAPAAAPAPTPAPEVAPPPAPLAAPVAEPNVLGEILGQPSKTDWTPQEIAQRVLSLPGMAGVVLASQEGLLVAGQMPAPLVAETMAAFLPRLFTHSVVCADEMQLGTLRAMRLSAGQAPCVVCKAGKLYLAVLGQPGQTLPEAVVEQLAVALAQHNY